MLALQLPADRVDLVSDRGRIELAFAHGSAQGQACRMFAHEWVGTPGRNGGVARPPVREVESRLARHRALHSSGWYMFGLPKQGVDQRTVRLLAGKI
jgi:hypothetical protein